MDKIIYSKNGLQIELYSNLGELQWHGAKRAKITLILRETREAGDFSGLWSLNDLAKRKVKSPSYLWRLFGDTLEKRLQEALLSLINEIDVILQKRERQKQEILKERKALEELLERIPSTEDSGLKRAGWHQRLKDGSK